MYPNKKEEKGGERKGGGPGENRRIRRKKVNGSTWNPVFWIQILILSRGDIWRVILKH